MSTATDYKAIADFCEAKLDLANAKLGDEYYYQSLPLCVIDTVFSIGVTYASTRNTVIRFCKHFGLERIKRDGLPKRSEQISIADFLEIYDEYGIDRMTGEVFRNRQRTSTRHGILKTEAVLMFSQVLASHDVNYLQDAETIIGNPEFEQKIRSIPGQKSGISLRYFYMLVGSDDYIKPDRMISRFIHSALNRTLSVEESHNIIVGAHKILKQAYPDLTLRALDHLIWNYQRAQ